MDECNNLKEWLSWLMESMFAWINECYLGDLIKIERITLNETQQVFNEWTNNEIQIQLSLELDVWTNHIHDDFSYVDSYVHNVLDFWLMHVKKT